MQILISPPFAFRHIRLLAPQGIPKGYYEYKLDKKFKEKHQELLIISDKIVINPETILTIKIINRRRNQLYIFSQEAVACINKTWNKQVAMKRLEVDK